MLQILLIYILGVIVMFGFCALDDTHGIFRNVLDKANDTTTEPMSDDPTRGWTALWISLCWPATMTILAGFVIVAYIKIYVIRTNPLNMMYDKVTEWMKKERSPWGKH